MGNKKYPVGNDLYIQETEGNVGILIVTKHDSIVVLEHEIKVLKDVLSRIVDERKTSRELSQDQSLLKAWQRGTGIVDGRTAYQVTTDAQK